VVYDRILQPASLERMVPTFSRDPEFALFLNEPFPSFSPGGRKLLYSAQGGNGLDLIFAALSDKELTATPDHAECKAVHLLKAVSVRAEPPLQSIDCRLTGYTQ
jgi:hypothetical protein